MSGRADRAIALAFAANEIVGLASDEGRLEVLMPCLGWPCLPCQNCENRPGIVLALLEVAEGLRQTPAQVS